MLDRLQRGLERLYRVETELDVGDFLISEDARDSLGLERAPREQLLLHETEGELSLGLFVDERAVESAAGDEPGRRFQSGNLGDFLLLVEGVSHFVYVAWSARHEKRVSALELEIQAEIDKYVTCILEADNAEEQSEAVRRRLFEEFEYHDDLDAEEQQRYAIANRTGREYSRSLERRFIQTGRLPDMLAELRQFYRLPLRGKLDFARRESA